MKWGDPIVPKTLLRNASLRFDKDGTLGDGAAMSAWVQIWVRFRTVILAAVAFGMVLLPAQAAHANMTPAKAESGHAMMIAQHAGAHGHAVAGQTAETGIDLAGVTNNQPGGHHDGQCCSGMCLSLALVDSGPSSARARIGLVRSAAPLQLASADAPEFLRPPLS